MPQLLVRDVPRDVVDALKRRAADHGLSAEAEHRAILEAALKAGRAGFRERAGRLRDETRGRIFGDFRRSDPTGARRAVIVVIDASVALKWVLDEPGADAADALLSNELVAPELWLLEAANALWSRARRAELTFAEAERRLAELRNAPVASSAISIDLEAALAWSNRLSHPVYDCLYLAAAIREKTHLVTANRRFHAVVGRSSDLQDKVRLLGT